MRLVILLTIFIHTLFERMDPTATINCAWEKIAPRLLQIKEITNWYISQKIYIILGIGRSIIVSFFIFLGAQRNDRVFKAVFINRGLISKVVRIFVSIHYFVNVIPPGGYTSLSSIYFVQLHLGLALNYHCFWIWYGAAFKNCIRFVLIASDVLIRNIVWLPVNLAVSMLS